MNGRLHKSSRAEVLQRISAYLQHWKLTLATKRCYPTLPTLGLVWSGAGGSIHPSIHTIIHYPSHHHRPSAVSLELLWSRSPSYYRQLTLKPSLSLNYHLPHPQPSTSFDILSHPVSALLDVQRATGTPNETKSAAPSAGRTHAPHRHYRPPLLHLPTHRCSLAPPSPQPAAHSRDNARDPIEACLSSSHARPRATQTAVRTAFWHVRRASVAPQTRCNSLFPSRILCPKSPPSRPTPASWPQGKHRSETTSKLHCQCLSHGRHDATILYIEVTETLLVRETKVSANRGHERINGLCRGYDPKTVWRSMVDRRSG